MNRAFIDASVFFAALYSPTGSARDLFRLAIDGKVILVVSQDILEEVERNILLSAIRPELPQFPKLNRRC